MRQKQTDGLLQKSRVEIGYLLFTKAIVVNTVRATGRAISEMPVGWWIHVNRNDPTRKSLSWFLFKLTRCLRGK